MLNFKKELNKENDEIVNLNSEIIKIEMNLKTQICEIVIDNMKNIKYIERNNDDIQ